MKIDPEVLAEILNNSVVTYRFATYYGANDYRCVEIVMDCENFRSLEKLLVQPIEGKLGKQFEGNP